MDGADQQLFEELTGETASQPSASTLAEEHGLNRALKNLWSLTLKNVEA